MGDELSINKSTAPDILSKMEFQPIPLEKDYCVTNLTRLPISSITALGTAFEPLATAVQKVAAGPGMTSGLYRVTIPSGTHLAELKNGLGNLGTYLNENNQIGGQAFLNPVAFDPTMVFMAATLANIDKKLDAIRELQQEMMDFLVQKERAELRGNLIFLSDILENYRYNWNNDMFKNSNHIKVLDIRQTAEQKIIFYREQIQAVLQKKRFILIDKEVQKQNDKVHSALKEYQLALYTYGFSSFLDVMLVGNYSSEYLTGIKEKIERYSFQYRELYTKCFNQMKESFDSSVEHTILKGLKVVSKATGEAIAKIPVLSDGPVDEALIEAGSTIGEIGKQHTQKQMKKLTDHQDSCVKPFVENIETVCLLYNNDISIVFDKDAVYLGVSSET